MIRPRAGAGGLILDGGPLNGGLGASIIVTTYNQLPYTKMCLESIAAFVPAGYELVVVDNASADGTREYLKGLAAADPGMKVIFNRRNRGFPAAANQGLRAASKDVLVLLNNDMVVSRNWMENLLNCLAEAGAGMVGPMCNFISGAQRIPTTYKDMGEMHAFAEAFNRPDPSKWRRATRLGGGSLAISRKLVEAVGYFDERFTPGNYEDDDYSLRAVAAGFKLFIAGDTFVHHFGNTTLRRDGDKAYENLLERNGRLLTAKWHTDDCGVAYFRSALADAVPPGGSRALDLCCKAGALGLELKNRGLSEVVGVETGRRLAMVATHSLDRVFLASPERVRLPYPEGYFDRVVVAGAFERAHDPWRLLRSVAGWLAPGGYLVTMVPNVSHVSVLANLLGGRWDYGLGGVLQPPHLRFFTMSTFVRGLREAGFQMVSARGLGGELNETTLDFLRDLEAVARKYGLAPGNLPMEGQALELLVVAKRT